MSNNKQKLTTKCSNLKKWDKKYVSKIMEIISFLQLKPKPLKCLNQKKKDLQHQV